VSDSYTVPPFGMPGSLSPGTTIGPGSELTKRGLYYKYKAVPLPPGDRSRKVFPAYKLLILRTWKQGGLSSDR